jgi:pyruvate dehydrogenase E1 component beta subunit
LAALINDKALLSLKAPIVRISGPDITIPLAQMENYYLPDTGRVVRAAKRAMEY